MYLCFVVGVEFFVDQGLCCDCQGVQCECGCGEDGEYDLLFGQFVGVDFGCDVDCCEQCDVQIYGVQEQLVVGCGGVVQFIVLCLQ